MVVLSLSLFIIDACCFVCAVVVVVVVWVIIVAVAMVGIVDCMSIVVCSVFSCL